jgi:hypothetical protein
MVLLVKLKDMLFDMNYNIMVLLMFMSFCGPKKNVESIGKKIIAFVPTILDATTNKFIESTCSMQILLYRLVVHKQSHNCHN